MKLPSALSLALSLGLPLASAFTGLAPRQQQACAVHITGLPMSSPQITYLPDGAAAGGGAWDWSASESEATSTGYLQYPRVKTSTAGAKFVYAFVGNGAKLNGTASPGASLSTRLEHLTENPDAHATTTLFPEGMERGILFDSGVYQSTGDWMRVSIEVVNGTFEFNRIEYSVFYTCNPQAPEGEDVLLDTISASPQPYELAGAWRGLQRDPTVSPGSERYQSLLEAQPGGALAFTSPPKAVYLWVHGVIKPTGGAFEVVISPPPPGPKADSNPASRTYTGSTKRPYGSTQPLWEGRLDPGTQYNISVVNKDASATLALYSVKSVVEAGNPKPAGTRNGYPVNETFARMDAPASTSSDSSSESGAKSGPNVGAIVGGVVGGLAGLLLLGGLGWWLWKKCRQDPFEDDASVVEQTQEPQGQGQGQAPYAGQPNMSQLTQYHSTGSFGMSTGSAPTEFGTASHSFATLPRALTPEGTGASYGTYGTYSGSDGTSAAAVASHSASFPALPLRSSFSSRNIPGSPLSALPPISTQSTGEVPPVSPLPVSPHAPYSPYSPGPSPGPLQLNSPVEAEDAGRAGASYGYGYGGLGVGGSGGLAPPLGALHAVPKPPRQVSRPRSRQPSRRLVDEAEQDTVPPSYDPTWADDFVDGQQYLEPDEVLSAINTPRNSGLPPDSPGAGPGPATQFPLSSASHAASASASASQPPQSPFASAADSPTSEAGPSRPHPPHIAAYGSGEPATPSTPNAPLAAHAIPPSPPSPGSPTDDELYVARPTSPAYSDFHRRPSQGQ